MRKIHKELMKVRIKETETNIKSTELEIELKQLLLKSKTVYENIDSENYMLFKEFKDVFKEKFTDFLIERTLNKDEMTS